MLMSCGFHFLALTSALAAAQTPSIDINRYPPQPQETICGDIVAASIDITNPTSFFPASQVFDCLTSVPFNSAVALRFLEYVNQTFQFHAPMAYIRNPPEGYQRPAFDFFGALQATADRVSAGAYHNQYAFETDVQILVRNLHDTHAYMYAGISSLFTFISPFRLVSVSVDGKQAPQLYVYDDLIQQVVNGTPNASPITEINGIAAADYASSFAANQSFGFVESNADWNQIMVSPAQEIFGLSIFSESAPFYAGDDLTLAFENGTTITELWWSLFASPGFTGPLETGGDFYNFFVLGLYPENFDDTYQAYLNQSSNSDDDITLIAGQDPGDIGDLTSWNSMSLAYPNDTINYQQDLGPFSEGVTGYFLSDVSTAVLSLPSFAQYGDQIDSFGQAIQDFYANATKRNAQKIIIDLQQNTGGFGALAFVVFDLFFTNVRPFSGSRMRAQETANILGDAQTSYFESLPNDPSNYTVQNYEDSEWVVTDRINALTGMNFTSWSQFYGPLSYNGDNFTLVEQYDLKNQAFVEAALGISIPSCYFSANCTSTQAWAASDIIILTDGICGSTCSLLVDMMQQQGVRTVAVGGLPEPGPMQAASGSRGAAAYTDEELYADYATTNSSNATAGAELPTDPPDTGIYGITLGFTLRDQIQQNQTTPNQVLYMPADCRLYWSLANFYNYTRLWQDVHDAIFTDSSLCVAGSQNAVAPSASSIATSGSTAHYIAEGLTYETITASAVYENATAYGINVSAVWDGVPASFPQTCDVTARNPCGQSNLQCIKTQFPCHSCADGSCGISPQSVGICTKQCFNGDDNSCRGGKNSFCAQSGHLTTRDNQRSTQSKGYCNPVWTTTNQNRRCSSIDQNSLVGFLS